MIALPPPLELDYPLGRAIAKRRSRRSWLRKPVELEKVSTLLWAAQGVTSREGFRASPSAGATYPLELYLVACDVAGLEPGIYHYSPREHSLRIVVKGSLCRELGRACLNQEWVSTAPLNIVIAAVFERTTGYYGRRGVGYVYIEVGHAAQNIYLVSEAMNLGTVAVGAFYDDEVAKVVNLSHGEKPLYVLPAGYPTLGG